jgi:F0F1-type ATP synthase assembly protein I
MAVNMAQKRAKKAQRRKQLAILAKREDAIYKSFPAQVARAAQAPIRHCCVNEGLFEIGMGTLVLTRGHTSPYNMAVFLLDSFALGVKDVMFRTMEGEQIEQYMAMADAGGTMVPIAPSDARKLLRELAAWSKVHGFAPHRDFAAVEKLFGDVNADDSDSVFRFGRDGKPVLIGDPLDLDAELLLPDEALDAELADQSELNRGGAAD